MAQQSLPGHDIFISYARGEGGTKYASGLSEALKARGFSSFIDTYGTEPSRDVPPSLLETIRRCRMFVVVATPLAGKRPAVATEVEAFLGTGRITSIVPIDFGGSLVKADWYGKVEGVAPAFETEEALRDGRPSDDVVTRIANGFTFRRREEDLSLLARRERKYWGVLRVLAVAIAAALVLLLLLLKLANDARAEANTSAVRADTARRAAEQAWFDVGMASITAVDATLNARHQQELAAAAAGDAEAKARLAAGAAARAQVAEKAARAARREAEHQQTIAGVRGLANRSQTLLRRSPDALVRAVSYAAEAVHKSSATNAPSVEADTALREALAQLPRFESGMTYDGDVTAVALSPGARHLATITSGKTLRVYATGDPRPLYELPCDGRSVAVSDGGARAAVADGHSVRVFDLKGGTSRLFDFKDINLGPGGAVASRHLDLRGVALSPAGRYLAVIQRNLLRQGSDALAVWDVEGGGEVARLAGQVGMLIGDVAFGPRGDLAAGGYGDGPQGRPVGKAFVWPLAERAGDDWEKTGRLTAEHFESPVAAFQEEPILNIAPGLRGDRFATGEAIWQTAGGEFAPVARIPHPEPAIEVAFTADGGGLVVVRRLPRPGDPWGRAVNGPKLVERWRASGYTDEMRVTLAGQVKQVGFLPGGAEVAVADPEGTKGVRRFRVADGAEVTDGAIPPCVGCRSEALLYISPDVRFSVKLVGDDVLIHDAWRSRFIKLPDAPELTGGWTAALDESGEHLVLAGLNESGSDALPGIAFIYTRVGDSYAEPRDLPLAAVPQELALSPGGHHLLVRAHRRTYIYRLSDGSEVTPDRLGELYYEDGSARFSPGGHYLAAIVSAGGSRGHLFRAWRTSDWREIMSSAPSKENMDFAFSPRGHFLFMSDGEGPARLLELATGRVSGAGRAGWASEGVVTAVAFSADESHVAVGDSDGSVRLYRRGDLENEIARLSHFGEVTAVAFSADGKYLVAASGLYDVFRTSARENYQVRVWLLRPSDLLAEARRRLGRLPPPPR